MNAHQEARLTNAHCEAGPSSLDRLISIEDIQPFPKASLRKPSNRGRKRRKGALLTDPVMLDSLRAEQAAATQKKSDVEARKKLPPKKKKKKDCKAAESDQKTAKIGRRRKQRKFKKNAPKRERGSLSAKKTCEPERTTCNLLFDDDEDTEEVIRKYKTRRSR